MTEAIIIAFLTQLALVIVALINAGRLQRNTKKLEQVQEEAVRAAKSAVTSAEEVSIQFKNNGGSTIKDQLDRIERRFEENTVRMNLLQQADINDRNAAVAAHQAIYAAISELEKKTEGHFGKVAQQERRHHGERGDLPKR